jgi:hypothetical protein
MTSSPASWPTDSSQSGAHEAGFRSEISDFKQKSDFLTAENTSLRQQCHEALSVADSMETVCTRNRQLAAELRSVKTERDELARRVKILVQSSNELHEQLEAMKAQKPKPQFDQPRLIQCDHEEQLRGQAHEIAELKAALAKEQRKTQELNGSVHLMLHDATTFFNAKIASLTELRELFLQPPKQLPIPDRSDLPENDPELIHAIQTTKMKLKQERKRRVQSEREATALKTQMKSLETSVSSLE